MHYLSTDGNASHQNGPVEYPHQTISQSVKAVLIAVGLDIKFWPYIFHHVIQLRNALPGCSQSSSPFQQVYKIKDNIKISKHLVVKYGLDHQDFNPVDLRIKPETESS